MRNILKDVAMVVLFGSPLAGCATRPPIAPVSHVDLDRYMGDWYVIAAIPTYLERHACRAVESYRLTPAGRIQTTFTYREGSPGGAMKTLHATGFVRPGGGNGLWDMQFVWPVKAQYVIAWLAPDYHAVIVARDKRDYVWLMARAPTLPAGEYDELVARIAALGYDTTRLRKVPQ